MTSLLNLTVGTDTTWKHSDVAAGLARPIDLTTPRLFWLVPSGSEKATPVVDLIRDSVKNPGAFPAQLRRDSKAPSPLRSAGALQSAGMPIRFCILHSAFHISHEPLP